VSGGSGLREQGGGAVSGRSLVTELCGVRLKNPVMTASGTFGSGREFSDFFDLNRLGAVVTKGVSIRPWEGNPTPRVCETPSGMLNAIGLQNAGVETFVAEDLAYLSEVLAPDSVEMPGTKVVVNVCGHTDAEYLETVERLADEKRVDMLEINISCPNVREGGIAFGTDPNKVESITAQIRERAAQPVIMKLSPNVTDITEIARAAEAGGADALSLINTITGMKIDVRTGRFALANRTGGLSGPAIHPVAVRMVWQTAQAVKIPLIGMGGIKSAEDALEMMLAGATAVSIGTAFFRDPCAAEAVIAGMEAYAQERGLASIGEIVGAVR